MANQRSDPNRLGLLIILLGMIGVTEVAEAQSQPPAPPTINNVKVRPSYERTDSGWSPTPYVGKSLPASDVKHVRTSHERMTGSGNGILNASDANRIRTTRERATDDSTPPAFAPLIPPPGQQ